MEAQVSVKMRSNGALYSPVFYEKEKGGYYALK